MVLGYGSVVSVPAVPLDDGSMSRNHRDNIVANAIPGSLCVARIVGSSEIELTRAAKAALKKEWDRLRSKDAWDESLRRECDDVRVEAKKKVCMVQMGLCVGICAEKAFCT